MEASLVLTCISGIITHQFQTVAKPTEALDTALVYLSLANPVRKLEVCRNPQVKLLGILGEMPIPIVDINKSQHLHNAD